MTVGPAMQHLHSTNARSGTVISIHEDVYPGLRTLTERQTKLLKIVRRNLANVFRELSKAPVAGIGQKPISILRIRGGLQTIDQETPEPSSSSVDEDAPSLLFFYLYDDWNSSYGLVARKEQQYGEELNRLVRWASCLCSQD